MARTTYWNPKTGRFQAKPRKRRRRRSVGSLGGLGAGKVSLKAIVRDVQSVAITGAIAAGGAILTENAVNKLAKNWNLSGWQRQGVILGTGVGLAIVIGKLLKKPKLATAFAIGPFVVVLMNLFADIMSKNNMAGLGLTTVRPALPRYDGFGDALTIGPRVPQSVVYPGRQPQNAVAGVI